MTVDLATQDRAERLLTELLDHPRQYVEVKLPGLVGFTLLNSETTTIQGLMAHTQRFQRCPTCNEWAPCFKRLALINQLVGLAVAPPPVVTETAPAAPATDGPYRHAWTFTVDGGREVRDGKSYYPDLLDVAFTPTAAWQVIDELQSHLRYGDRPQVTLSGQLREVDDQGEPLP